MNTLLNYKTQLFSNWHFMRWLRLVLGGYIAYQAILNHDPLAGMIAVFFLFQALTNTGCCGSGGCAVPVSEQKNTNAADVEFEEIKSESSAKR